MLDVERPANLPGEESARYFIRPMLMSDVPRVIEVEKLSYPATWPQSAYRKELQDNRWAHYVVLQDRDIVVEMPEEQSDEGEHRRRIFPLSLFNRSIDTSRSPELASIIGFAGLWLMVDEAHITTIAIHPEYRHMGLGELLLTSMVDIAYSIGAKWVTLEVRVSNIVAQNLYRKYGFHEAGIRHHYYSDNGEDALIMWTDEISSPAFKDLYSQLRAQLGQKIPLSSIENQALGS